MDDDTWRYEFLFRPLYGGYPVYVDGSGKFTVEYHHGGKPRFDPVVVYEGGSIVYRDFYDKDYICLLDIDLDVRALGYKGYMDYFWVSDVNNLSETRPLKNDLDVLDMANAAVENGGYIHIYLVERSDADVIIEELQSSKSSVLIQELNDEEPSIRRCSVVIEELDVEESSKGKYSVSGQKRAMDTSCQKGKAVALITAPLAVDSSDEEDSGGEGFLEEPMMQVPQVPEEEVTYDDIEAALLNDDTEASLLPDDIQHHHFSTDDDIDEDVVAAEEDTDSLFASEDSVDDDDELPEDHNELAADDGDVDLSEDGIADADVDLSEDDGVADFSDDVEEDHAASTDSDEQPPEQIEGTSSLAANRSKRAGKRPVTRESSDDEEQAPNVDEDSDENSQGFVSMDSSDEDVCRKRKFPEFYAATDMKTPYFQEGMLFDSTETLKKAVKRYGIINKVNVAIVRNNTNRVNAECLNCKGWLLHASRNTVLNAIQVKKLKDQHTCGKELPKRYITNKWIAEEYLPHLRADSSFSIKSMSHQLDLDFKAKAHRTKLWRAKRRALEMLRSSEVEQYAKLRDYAGELKKMNDGSTIFINCDNMIFQRMYVCIEACKRGFLEGCRPLVGLDGCWLKGRYKGQLLAAVGMDANDCIFPIAYAVVEIESGDSWSWFINNLANDLNIQHGSHWTFMADKEKGLVQALDTLMPFAEKRFWRHLWMNLCRVDTLSKGKELNDLIWQAARASYPAEFNRCMEMLKAKDREAWEWLSSKPASQWSRSHFQEFSKCDTLVNNLSECFNRFILDARDKPILTLLEEIRSKLMNRMASRRKLGDRFTEATCPKILKKLEKAKEMTRACWAEEAGLNKFTVHQGRKMYIVDLDKRACSCRNWQLSSIPCPHGIACIQHYNKDPTTFIHACYSVGNFKASYAPIIYPLRDMEDYDPTNEPPIQPPVIKAKKGRPQKKRRRGPDESPTIVGKDGVHSISRRGSVIIKCTTCGAAGHNKRTCSRRSTQGGSQNALEGSTTPAATPDPVTSTPVVDRPTPEAGNQPFFSSFISRNVQEGGESVGARRPPPAVSAFLAREIPPAAAPTTASGRRVLEEFLSQQLPRRSGSSSASASMTQPPPQ